MPLEVVSFDMEGTLIEPRFSELIWEHDIPRLYAKRRGLTLEEARRRVFAEYMEIGDERPEWYDIEYWFRRLDLPGDWRELLEARRGVIRPYPEVRGVLERLGERYRLIVTSNTMREFLEVQLEGLREFFTHVFSAPSDFGEVKKTAGFYRRICDIVDVEPTSMAHVGDHWRFDYLTPRSMGMEAYYLNRGGERRGIHIVHDLEEFEARIRELDG
ncbi:MAG: haloacid dehalogenase superfamily enzyme, subfamily IA [Candidatus Bathyarchaeota archaeon B23]|nr:MAG: haloacid dehalogenase superfamily enzyme, subfamily IA [Candidatus Bathyarchaeota archaeon B23]